MKGAGSHTRAGRVCRGACVKPLREFEWHTHAARCRRRPAGPGIQKHHPGALAGSKILALLPISTEILAQLGTNSEFSVQARVQAAHCREPVLPWYRTMVQYNSVRLERF